MKRYWKFLDAGGIGPLSRFDWSAVGTMNWHDADAPAICVRGVHALRLQDLPYWMSHELWEVELGGAIEYHETKVVAERGRLVREVTGWDDACRADFSWSTLGRIYDRGAEQLDRLGEPDRALAWRAMVSAGEWDLAEAKQQAVDARQVAQARDEISATRVLEYVVDATDLVGQEYPLAMIAYAGARSAEEASGPAGYEAERRTQASWIRNELDL